MGVAILSRKQFNRRCGPLPVPPSEVELLHGLAAEEGGGFPRLLVSRGLLSPEGLLRAYQAHCGIPVFRRDPKWTPPPPRTPSRFPSFARNS